MRYSLSITRTKPQGAILLLALACAGSDAPPHNAASSDSASFAQLQARGAGVMGVDQYTSMHVFESLPDGGRIVLERADSSDSAAVSTIRAHMREIVIDFRAGDFTKPFSVHAQEVPGTRVMTARKEHISYDAADRLRGAEVRIRSTDSTAIAAVHAFLAFQRSDHRAAGHDTSSAAHSAHTGRGGF